MKKLILSCSLLALTAPAYAALDCAPLPDCEDFGYVYTADDCDGQSTLKCPFDQTKLYCTEPGGKQAATVTCKVGSILYNDLKCYDGKPSGKTAIAVVFDHNKKLAIAMDHKNYIPWGGSGTDISGLDNCSPSNFSTCGTDGKDNTQKIVSALGTGSDYAAGYCYNKTDGGLDKGSWFLPSIVELKLVFNNGTTINTAMTAAGGTTIPSSDANYWPSAENDSLSALFLNLTTGSVGSHIKSTSYSEYYARCAVQY